MGPAGVAAAAGCAATVFVTACVCVWAADAATVGAAVGGAAVGATVGTAVGAAVGTAVGGGNVAVACTTNALTGFAVSEVVLELLAPEVVPGCPVAKVITGVINGFGVEALRISANAPNINDTIMALTPITPHGRR